MKSNDSTPFLEIKETKKAILKSLIKELEESIKFHEDKIIGANMLIEKYTNQLTQLN